MKLEPLVRSCNLDPKNSHGHNLTKMPQRLVVSVDLHVAFKDEILDLVLLLFGIVPPNQMIESNESLEAIEACDNVKSEGTSATCPGSYL